MPTNNNEKNSRGNKIIRFTLNNYDSFQSAYHLPDFVELKGGDCFSHSLKNDSLKQVVTWCEGDVIVCECHDEESYMQEIQAAVDFHVNA